MIEWTVQVLAQMAVALVQCEGAAGSVMEEVLKAEMEAVRWVWMAFGVEAGIGLGVVVWYLGYFIRLYFNRSFVPVSSPKPKLSFSKLSHLHEACFRSASLHRWPACYFFRRFPCSRSWKTLESLTLVAKCKWWSMQLLGE